MVSEGNDKAGNEETGNGGRERKTGTREWEIGTREPGTKQGNRAGNKRRMITHRKVEHRRPTG